MVDSPGLSLGQLDGPLDPAPSVRRWSGREFAALRNSVIYTCICNIACSAEACI